MADAEVLTGENSPEQIAYKLFQLIASVEKRSLDGDADGPHADRAYILKTYYQCWTTVRGNAPDVD